MLNHDVTAFESLAKITNFNINKTSVVHFTKSNYKNHEWTLSTNRFSAN